MIGFGHHWRYDASGRDLGEAWREAGFDDSGWAEGAGGLGANDNPAVAPFLQTPVPLVDAGGEPIVTFYFRARFVWTGETEGFYLTFTNLVDDGAVVYLNGEELYRLNLPDDPIDASMLTTHTAAEGEFEVRHVDAPSLVVGTNVLAVEVHQSSIGSSDVVLVLSADRRPMAEVPVIVLRPPSPVAASAG